MSKLYITKKDLAEHLSRIVKQQDSTQLGPIAKILAIFLVVVTMILLIPIVLFWAIVFILYIPINGVDRWLLKKLKGITNG